MGLAGVTRMGFAGMGLAPTSGMGLLAGEKQYTQKPKGLPFMAGPR